MARIVHLHHVNKDAFLKGNEEPDLDEHDLVFDASPNYVELLEEVRKELNWMDPSDMIMLEGRHNVGFGHHTRWKTMGINSEQRWLAYKEVVAESQDKALEIFATKRVDVRSTPPMHQDELSQPILTQQEVRQTLSPPRMNLEELSQPSLTQQEVNQTLSPPRMNQEENMNDVCEDEENDVDLYDREPVASGANE